MERKYDSLVRDPLISLVLACKCMLKRHLESVLSTQGPSFLGKKNQVGLFLLKNYTSLCGVPCTHWRQDASVITCRRTRGDRQERRWILARWSVSPVHRDHGQLGARHNGEVSGRTRLCLRRPSSNAGLYVRTQKCEAMEEGVKYTILQNRVCCTCDGAAIVLCISSNLPLIRASILRLIRSSRHSSTACRGRSKPVWLLREIICDGRLSYLAERS